MAAEVIGDPVPYKGLFLQEMRVSDFDTPTTQEFSEWWVLQNHPASGYGFVPAGDHAFPSYDRAKAWADLHLAAKG